MRKKNITINDLANAVDNLASAVKQGFDNVDKRFDGVDSRFDKVENRLKALEEGQEDIKMRLVNACPVKFKLFNRVNLSI